MINIRSTQAHCPPLAHIASLITLAPSSSRLLFSATIHLVEMATRRIFTSGLARTSLAVSRPQSPLAPASLSYSTFATPTIPSQAPSWPKVWSPVRPHQTHLATATRSFSTTSSTRHGHVQPPKPGEELWITFIDKDNQEHKIAVSKGDNLLDIAQEHDLEMEGACGGSCACSTCHVIVLDEAYYDKMPEPDDDENDMLDLAFGLTETSRLGCQVVMTPELDGMVVKLPSMTRNLQASDFKS